MFKRSFLLALGGAVLLSSACTTTSGTAAASPASRRQSIDAAVDSALSRLRAEVPESTSLVTRAKGILVFPSVVTAGLVVGGSYGNGALRESGRTSGYYSTATGSVGWLAGAESKAVYILFMTNEALAKFKASQGWTAGVDATITVVSVGATAEATTQTVQQPIVGYVLTNGGLMANLSFEGTKFTRLDL